MRDRIYQCLNNIGILIEDTSENIHLSDYVSDSLDFISFIVELEKMFEIEFSDEFMIAEDVLSMDTICRAIDDAIKERLG